MPNKISIMLVSLLFLTGPLSLISIGAGPPDEGPDPVGPRSTGSRAGPYASSSFTHVRLGNDHIEMTFDKSLNGSIDSIIDKGTGHDFRNDKAAPPLLFLIYLWNGTGPEFRLNWEANLSAIDLQTTSNSARVTFDYSMLAGYDIFIQVTVSVQKDDDHISMTIRIINNDNVTIKYISFPVIWGLGQIGTLSSDDTIMYPRGDGLLIHDPLSHLDGLNLFDTYPSSLSMQLMGYYDEGETGLYAASFDASGYPKEMIMSGMEWGGQKHLAAQFKLLLPEEKGNDFSMSYSIIIGTFQGDWHDAADIYQDWAVNQSFVNGGKVFETKDTPDWWGNTSVIQMVNRDNPAVEIRSLADMVTITGEFHDLTDLNMTLMIHGWEGNGAWVGPYYYPPAEGENDFKDAMSDLTSNGDRGFTYISGTVWRVTRDDIGYADHALFNSTGLPWVATNESGEPMFDPFYETLGWHSARMDPMTDFWHDMIVNNTLDSIRLGVQVVQVDEFPIGSIYPCYNTTHGHAAGYTNELTQAYISILQEIRTRGRAIDPDFILSLEEPSELYLPYMDSYVSRDNAPESLLYGPMVEQYGDDAEFIPMFQWVYHDYITSFGEHLPMGDSFPLVLYRQVARSLARTFITGEIQNGAAAIDSEMRPGLKELYNRTARATATYGNKYLIEGSPLVTSPINVPSREVEWFNWFAQALGTPIHEDAVLTSAWEADDGDLGLTFVNWDNSTHTFDVEVPRYDLAGDNYTLLITRNGVKDVLLHRTQLPVTVPLTMDKNDVVLIEVTRMADLKVDDVDLVLKDPSPLTNEMIDLNLTVHNTGSLDAGSFDVRFSMQRVNDTQVVQIGDNLTLGSLQEDATVSLGVILNTTGIVGDFKVFAEVDINDMVDEIDETNNTATISMTVDPRPRANLTVLVVNGGFKDEPLRNATVNLFIGNTPEPNNLTGGAFSDINGEALFDDLIAGEYHIVVNLTGFYPQNRTIDLIEGENRTLTFWLEWEPPVEYYWIITGLVRDNKTGAPIEGANTSVFDMGAQVLIDETVTNEQGMYELRGLPLGTMTITANKEGYYMQVKNLLVNFTPPLTLDFLLDPILVDPMTGDMEGYVTDAETGEIIEDAFIEFIDPMVSVQTDGDGYYFHKDIPNGTYVVYVHHFPEYEMNKSDITIIANRTILRNFTLSSRTTPIVPPVISGKVIDEEGNPLEGAKVERTNHVDPLWTLTDENGTFEFKDLETGDYVFRISLAGYHSEVTRNYYVGYSDLMNLTIVLEKRTNPNPKPKPPPGFSSNDGRVCIGLIVVIILGLIIISILIIKRIRRSGASTTPGVDEEGKEGSLDGPVGEDDHPGPGMDDGSDGEVPDDTDGDQGMKEKEPGTVIGSSEE